MFPTGKVRDEGGYTLLELLLAISLLSVAAMAVVVWVPDVADRTAVLRAADRIERELARVAQEAARDGRVRTVTLSGRNGLNRMDAGQGMFEIDSTISVSWTAAVEAGSGAEPGIVAFFGTGEASGGRIELRRGRSVAEIEVDWLTAGVHRRR